MINTSKLYMKFLCAVFFMYTHSLQAQTPQVVISQEPPQKPQTQLMFYTGSNLTYICIASGWLTQTQWSISGGSLTSIVVVAGVATVTTSTAHGLVGDSAVTITGSSNSLMNVTTIVNTVPTSTTFTLHASLPDGTYTENALRITTTQPRTSTAIWTIKRFTYSVSNLITDVKTSQSGQICDNRASSGSTRIAYQ